MNRQFEIRFSLRDGSQMQTIIIRATDASVARRIFQQQFPAAKIVGTPKPLAEHR
jgi:hypothetical protein